MKARVEYMHLKAAMAACTQIVDANATRPLAHCIRLTTAPDQLIVDAVHEAMLLRVEMPAEIVEPGEVLCEPERLPASKCNYVDLHANEAGYDITADSGRLLIGNLLPDMAVTDYFNVDRLLRDAGYPLAIERMGLNPHYLERMAKALKALTGGEAVLLAFHGVAKPIRITPTSKDAPIQFEALLLPVRI